MYAFISLVMRVSFFISLFHLFVLYFIMSTCSHLFMFLCCLQRVLSVFIQLGISFVRYFFLYVFHVVALDVALSVCIMVVSSFVCSLVLYVCRS